MAVKQKLEIIPKGHKIGCNCCICRNIRRELQGINHPTYNKDPWNKGLTKETDSRVLRSSVKSSESHKDTIPWNKNKHYTRILRETRTCSCGCGELFECKVTSKQKYLYQHGTLNKTKSRESIEKQVKSRHETAIKQGYYHSTKTIEKIGNKNKGKTSWCAGLTKETNHSLLNLSKKVSNSITNLWKDPKYRNKQTKSTPMRLKKMLKSVCQRPNKFEFKALEYLNSIYDNKFKYTGDGTMIVNHRSADAYSKELNTIALFHGYYWHLKKLGLEVTEENKRMIEKVDSLPFLSSGYKVIFIWEDDLTNILEYI